MEGGQAVEGRAFVPARADVARLSALAGLEKLSVASYNVLSQLGARRLLRPGAGYVDPAVLNINRRRQLLLSEVLSLDADVLCLQEVDDYDDWWVDKLSVAGYDSVYARARGADHGLVTALRRDTFQLFRSAQVDLNNVCDRINDPNLAARARQDNVALLTCLQPWEKSKLPSAICVANTQLAASPSLEQVRVLQAEFLCREIAVFNADFHLPVILTGTFNAVPSSDVYHVIITGRRRPHPEAPPAPLRPTTSNPSSSSVTVCWELPVHLVDPEQPKPQLDQLPVLEYKVAIKNCSSARTGFLNEMLVAAPATEAIVSTLSAGVTYQFRVSARNENGWGHWSQPSTPIETPRPVKASTGPPTSIKLHLVRDTPPQVKSYNPSFGSGRTPRFTNDGNTEAGSSNNFVVCPRALLTGAGPAAMHACGEGEPASGAKSYATIVARGDRDDKLVHSEQFESAYGEYFEYLCEPELTFASEKFQGTIDYIFYSTSQLAPFQLLSLPSLDELEEMGQDDRLPRHIEDTEWIKHRPSDWRDALTVTTDEDKYMGEWRAPELPNVSGRAVSWLPNRTCPSDHLPLACVFAMRTENLSVTWN